MIRRPPGVEVLLDGAATGGAFCLLRLVLEPAGEAGWHAHTREDETLVVVEGDLDVETEAGEQGLEPGEAAFLRRGVRHAFRAGQDGAHVLVFATPSGLEDFFRALPDGVDPQAAADAAGLVLG